MTNEELLAKVGELEAQVAKAEADLATATAAQDTPDDAGSDNGDGEEPAAAVEKRLSGQIVEIRKALDDANNRAAAAEKVAKSERDARRTQEMTREAEKEFPNLPGTSEEKGLVLKSLRDSLPQESQEKVIELLRAGNAAMGQVTAPVGKSVAGATVTGGSAWEKIEKKAQAMASADNITFPIAVTKIMEQEPGLYDEYLKEQN